MKEPAPGSRQVVTGVAATVPGLETGTAEQIAGDGVVRLVAGQLSVGKRLVEGEGVRVHLTTEQEEAAAAVPLRAERIEVERVPVGRVVDAAPRCARRMA